MKSTNVKRLGGWTTAALLSLTPMHTQALDLTVVVGYGANYTDNTELTPNNEVAEWIQTPQAVGGIGP